MTDPFTRELALIVDDMKSPKARSRMLASFAREQIEKTSIENATAAGRTLRKPVVAVDGRQGVPLGTVKPDGTIVAEWNTETNAVRWIMAELRQISPERTGAYEHSHTVYADGAQVTDGAELPDAREYVLASDLPYARKLDPDDDLPARSKQAPQGVYAAIAAVAAKRFPEDNVRFTFRDVPVRGKAGTARNPAIVVRPSAGRPGEV